MPDSNEWDRQSTADIQHGHKGQSVAVVDSEGKILKQNQRLCKDF